MIRQEYVDGLSLACVTKKQLWEKFYSELHDFLTPRDYMICKITSFILFLLSSLLLAVGISLLFFI